MVIAAQVQGHSPTSEQKNYTDTTVLTFQILVVITAFILPYLPPSHSKHSSYQNKETLPRPEVGNPRHVRFKNPLTHAEFTFSIWKQANMLTITWWFFFPDGLNQWLKERSQKEADSIDQWSVPTSESLFTEASHTRIATVTLGAWLWRVCVCGGALFLIKLKIRCFWKPASPLS